MAPRRFNSLPALWKFLNRWSPDGKRIAFAARKPGTVWKLYLVSAEGGAPQQVISGAGGAWEAVWSADGKSLVYDRYAQGPYINRTTSGLRLEMMDLSTRRVWMLPGSEGVCCPRWTPDGHFLEGSMISSDSPVLHRYEVATGKWTKRADSEWSQLFQREKLNPEGHFAIWSDDWKRVVVEAIKGTSRRIYRARAADYRVESVMVLEGIRRVQDYTGAYLGVTPDGSILVLRDVGIQEVYALDWEAP